MKLMPGTVLKELDETDIDSLLPWYLWRTSHTEGKTDSDIIWRDGKPYKRVMAKDAAWLKNTF
jgi:hypothetical protein